MKPFEGEREIAKGHLSDKPAWTLINRLAKWNSMENREKSFFPIALWGSVSAFVDNSCWDFLKTPENSVDCSVEISVKIYNFYFQFLKSFHRFNLIHTLVPMTTFTFAIVWNYLSVSFEGFYCKYALRIAKISFAITRLNFPLRNYGNAITHLITETLISTISPLYPKWPESLLCLQIDER